jgi:hypothetical protein
MNRSSQIFRENVAAKKEESRIRGLAKRNGYLVRKSKQRTCIPNSDNYGHYMLATTTLCWAPGTTRRSTRSPPVSSNPGDSMPPRVTSRRHFPHEMEVSTWTPPIFRRSR